MPKTNRDYWQKKIHRNMERDRANQIQLLEQGWRVLIIWECSVEEGIEEALDLFYRTKKDQ